MNNPKDDKPRVMRGIINGKATYSRIPILNKYPLPSEDTAPIEVWHQCIRHAMMVIRVGASDIGSIYRVLNRAMKAFEGIEYSYDEGETFELMDASPFHDLDKENPKVIGRHEQLLASTSDKKP